MRTLFLLLATQSPPPAMPSPDSVRAIVAARLTDSRVPGLAVGRLDGEEVLRITEGKVRRGSPAPVTPGTAFEIGSLTKAFTGVLLADMVLRGEVSLDDPVAKHLPPGMKVPEKDGVVITLRHLTTHTSGLPRLPGNLAPKDPEDPYSDYDSARLLAFLADHQLRRLPGATYEYSNLSAGLLGYALAHRAGMSYAALLRQRIFEPLRMSRSDLTETPALLNDLATGHNMMGEPVKAWHFDALAGAGAIRSTLDDMLRFAAAARDTLHGPLARVMALSQREHYRVDSVTSVGFGWHRRTRAGRTLVWHNGGTGGFRSMLVVDAGAGRAAMVLSNTAHGHDALGYAMLDASAPIPPLPAPRVTVAVDPAILARYPGRYLLAPGFVITITPRGAAGIDLQATGQPKLRLYASSSTDFFVTEAEASLTFETDASGRVVALVLHQNGAHRRAAREP